MTITVYTAVSPGYDKRWTLKPQDGVEFEWREPGQTFAEQPSHRAWNRYHRHEFFPEGVSLYLDGNIRPRLPVRDIVEELLGDAEIAAFKHPHRDDVHDEIEACLARKKITKGQAITMHDVLSGAIPHGGMWELGVLIRRSTPATRSLGNQIMASMEFANVWRDQPFFAHFVRGNLRTIDADIRDNKWFQFRSHGK